MSIETAISSTSRSRRISTEHWLPALTFALLLVLWEATVRVFNIATFILPAPSVIAVEMWNNRTQLAIHTSATLLTTLIAFAVTVSVTVPLAILITAIRLLQKTIYPLIVLMQAVPKIAIAPLLVVVLGSGEAPKIVIAFLVAFFPLLVDTTTGLKAVPPELLELSRSLRSSQLQEFVKIRIPTAVPFFFSGLKVAVAFCVLGAVVAEFVQSDRGLGYLIVVSTSFWKTPLAFGALVILAVMGLSLFFLVSFIERRFFSWYSHG